MKPSTIAIISLAGTLALAIPAMAQDENSGAPQPDTSAQSSKVVQQGNTAIVFQPAGTSNLDTTRLQTWNEFAQMHPRMAKALAYNPSLMDDSGFLSKHRDLGAFFQAHPDIKEAMAKNPGNFNAIPPRPGE